MEMLAPAPSVVVDSPLADEEDDDDQSVTSTALGIESSATSFTGGITAPRHVLLELDDDEGDLQSLDGDSTIAYDSGDGTVDYEGDGDAPPTTSSRFWGVCWDRRSEKWRAQYVDADGKTRHIGHFDDEEEAARAHNKKVRDAGLEGQRRINEIDAAGALVPKAPGAHNARDRSAVVAPDPARAPTAPTSKFWGVGWDKHARRWKAHYTDADGKLQHIGLFDTQEAAAHAVNAAIRRAGLEGRRKTNPVVDGQLVPRALKARGHGPGYARNKRRRDEPAATPSPRSRRR
jgi:hypothetical protein